MNIKYPCGICKKAVANNQKAIECDICHFWVHCKCNFVPISEYNDLMDDANNNLINEKDKKKWICITCINNNISLGNLDDKEFYLHSKGINSDCNLENITFNLSDNDKKLTEMISKLIIENTDPENTNSNFCNYYEIEDFIKENFKKDSSLSTLHLNIASLPFHHEQLKILLASLNFEFDCIMITETKIQIGTIPYKDINIPNYHYFLTHTQAQKGGTLIYISNQLI